MTDKPFWQTKNLNQLTRSEWESLCDGCGQCCLHKLQDEDTDEIYWTSVACTLLNPETCQCRDYPNRKKTVPDCVFLTPEIVDEVDWLPVTCAYRLVAEGSDLYWWHPFVSGSPETVHEAGISVRGKVTAFDHDMQDDDDYLDHMVTPDKIAR
ncbi:YcgN family cysteine cluster protein [Brucella sp. 10RB9213]|uniref:YcgN family cysteine cluster protein n=1 Tax=Brucella sp. 10RB9213 TaxID=1844039 RepID=UPI0012AE9772|nr:YcgN family cysteine cluster protein [Brucella sp. 10RB9213]MRN65549.1 YcgN family cysteine cluster protein [Brucella sp. 10RB9213]